MKGDFSDFAIPGGLEVNACRPYDAVLLQQGRPIMDAQFNELALSLMMSRRRAIKELHGDVVFVGQRKPEVTKNTIIFSTNIIYVDGIRAEIEEGWGRRPADGTYVLVVKDGSLLGTKLETKREGSLYVEVLQGTLSRYGYGSSTGNGGQPILHTFADPAVPSSDSLRLTHAARLVVGFGDPASDERPPEIDVRPVNPSAEMDNHLHRFEVHSVQEPSEGQVGSVTIKWSKNNGATVLEAEDETTRSRRLKVGGLDTVHPGPIEAGQYVEFQKPSLDFELPGRLVEIVDVIVPEGVIVLAEDAVPAYPGLVRIWDGVEELPLGEANTTFGNLRVTFPGCSHWVWDYWVVPVGESRFRQAAENGEQSLKAARSRPLLRKKIATLTIENAESGLQISPPFEPVAGARLASFLAGEPPHGRRPVLAADTPQVTPPRESLFDGMDLPLAELARKMLSGSLKRWLVSAFLSEIANLGMNQLREKIESTVEVPDRERDQFEKDLEEVVRTGRRWADEFGLGRSSIS